MSAANVRPSAEGVPALARVGVGGICSVLLLTGAGEAVLSVARAPTNISTLGFAAVVVVASAFGLLFAAGKLRDTPAMTVACIAGAVLVCSGLGYLGMDRWFVPLSKTWWLLGRGVLFASLLAITVWLALGSCWASWRSIATSVLASLPLIALGAWYKFTGLRPLLTATDGLAEGLRLLALVGLAGVALASICAMIHFSIRAFELASESGDAALTERGASV